MSAKGGRHVVLVRRRARVRARIRARSRSLRLLLLGHTGVHGQLMVLLGVEHHLLVGPLRELCVRVVHLRLRRWLGREVSAWGRHGMGVVVHLGLLGMVLVLEVLRVLGVGVRVLEVLGVELHLREVASLWVHVHVCAHLHMPGRRVAVLRLAIVLGEVRRCRRGGVR